MRLVGEQPVVADPKEIAPTRRVGEQRVVRRVEISHGRILALEYRNQIATIAAVAQWSFLTNHARALLCIAHDPGLRLRDMAEELGITERSAFAIVGDLTEAGYVVKERDGRRNRYSIQRHMPLPDSTGRAHRGRSAQPARRKPPEASKGTRRTQRATTGHPEGDPPATGAIEEDSNRE